MTGQSIAHYKITAKLGEGGMGEVWRATDTKLNRDVALKLLAESFAKDPDRMARFQREAHVLAALNHPNIAAIYGLEDRALVMELVEGQPLSGLLPIDTALQYARQIADALEAAHEKGITHRDLKPANILVTPEGQIKVLDFGLAKAAESTQAPGDPDHSPTLTLAATRMGVIMGTAAYMAPEQARGQNVDKRADIWAFGVILYELLTGQRMFAGDTVSDTLAQVLTRQPDWSLLPATTPAGVRRLLRRCLERDRRNRLHDIADARLELNEPDAPPPPPQFVPKRNILPWAIAGALAAALLIAGIALYRGPSPVDRPLLRFDADLGPGVAQAPRSRGANVILSPDGTRQVVVAEDSQGKTHLLTRRFDQPKSVRLEGTEEADDPFFSPDGQWVAFSAGRKLKKVSVDGGAALTLCDAPTLRGGSWGEDGYIVASLEFTSGLFRIPSSGGKPIPITQFDKKRGEVRHRFPQVLQGGKAVLFTASTQPNVYDDANLDVVTLADGRRKTVHQGGAWGRYLPSGHLIFLHKGTLFAAPFSLDRLEATGAPSPILENVAFSVGRPQFDFSQTGVAVYQTGVDLLPSRTIQWLDSSGKTQPLLSKPGFYMSPRFSPDGKRLALSALDRGAGTTDIWVYEWQRDTMTRLTFGGALSPVWTPDGKHIVCREQTGGISMVRADGADRPRRLREDLDVPTPWSFTPDGKQLAFTAGGDIWTLLLEGGPENPTPGNSKVLLSTQFAEFGPAFSPDGKWLAYSSNETGALEIFVRVFPDTGGKWQISNSGGWAPVWSRNGRDLYYQTPDNRIMVASYQAAGKSFVPEKPRLWSDKPFENPAATIGSNFDLAPDGKRFAVVMSVEDAGGEKPRPQVTFLFNFFDELRRKVPPGGGNP